MRKKNGKALYLSSFGTLEGTVGATESGRFVRRHHAGGGRPRSVG